MITHLKLMILKAAFFISQKDLSARGSFTIWPFSHMYENAVLTAEQITEAVHARILGQSMCCAMLFDRGSLAASP